MKDYNIKFLEQDLFLHPNRAVYWENKRLLLISDLHIGKAGHFRKAGIPVPKDVHADDLNRLSLIVHHYQPAGILILGDLFHSELNAEWHDFMDFVQRLKVDTVDLVMGNHDILPTQMYTGITKHINNYILSPFVFSHKPLNGDYAMESVKIDDPVKNMRPGTRLKTPSVEKLNDLGDLFNVCGHVHPGVRIPVGLRQSIRAPCFYFGKKHAILPAFGIFTGNYVINPTFEDSIYAIVEERIIHLKNEKF